MRFCYHRHNSIVHQGPSHEHFSHTTHIFTPALITGCRWRQYYSHLPKLFYTCSHLLSSQAAADASALDGLRDMARLSPNWLAAAAAAKGVASAGAYELMRMQQAHKWAKLFSTSQNVARSSLPSSSSKGQQGDPHPPPKRASSVSGAGFRAWSSSVGGANYQQPGRSRSQQQGSSSPLSHNNDDPYQESGGSYRPGGFWAMSCPLGTL